MAQMAVDPAFTFGSGLEPSTSTVRSSPGLPSKLESNSPEMLNVRSSRPGFGQQGSQRNREAPKEYSPAAWALLAAGAEFLTRKMGSNPPTRSSQSLRKAQSSAVLSPRLGSHGVSKNGGGFFGGTRWYGKAEKENESAQPSDEVSKMVREALRRRRMAEAAEEDSASSSSASRDSFERLTLSPASSTSGSTFTSNSDGKCSDRVDLDDLPSFDFSPPRRPRSPLRSSSDLRQSESSATLKAPRLLRRVSSSSSVSAIPVHLPPRSPHSPSTAAIPTIPTDLVQDVFSPPLSASTLSLSTSTSTSTSASSAASDRSFRSRLLTLHKAASTAALQAFRREPPSPSTASTLLRGVLLKHDASFEPSSPFLLDDLHQNPFDVEADLSADELSTCSSAFDDADEPDSPSSAFPPFDPFTNLLDDATLPAAVVPVPPPSPRARLLARQRSFIDPKTHILRTVPKLTFTPPTPDKPSSRLDQDQAAPRQRSARSISSFSDSP
ncbi:hypothetical protein JCM1841_000502 [Sporobolomyces salmonicolor]